MKKLLALTLALLLALSCISAFADTINTRITIDSEVAKGVVSGFGVPEEQLAMLDPVFALVNALGVKVVTLADGAQIDLDLNDANALSLGFATDEAGVSVASTLFPNYIITASNETIAQIMEQVSSSMPGAGGAGGGFDMAAMTEVFGGYYQRWFEACAAAGQPGEPESGEFEINGMLFDTKVPVTVDMPAIIDATRNLLDELLADPVAMNMIKGYAQGMAQGSGETVDDADFETQFKAGFEEWMAHIPAEATAEYYASSEDAEIFFLTGEAFEEGTEEAICRYEMMSKGEGVGYMGYWDNRMDMIIGFEYSDAGFFADFTMGEMYFGLGFDMSDGEFSCDLYFMNSVTPVLNVKVAVAGGGERTLSLDAEGKTVLSVEEAMSDQSGAAAQGLMGDIMGNGVGMLMGTASEQVPGLAELVSSFFGGGEAQMAG